MEIIVTSYVNPIHAGIDGQDLPEQVNIEVNSRISSIGSNVERRVAVLKNVEGYSSRIRSNVSTEVLGGNEEIREISSHIIALNSHVVTEIYRQPISVERYVTGHTRSVQVNTGVLIHIEPIPIHATISFLVNPSNTFYIKNPSYVEVIK